MAIPRLISPDDHIQEPAHVWETRLPARLRDRGPPIERLQGRGDLGAGEATYQLLGQAAEPEIATVVDPQYSVACILDKRYLPQ